MHMRAFIYSIRYIYYRWMRMCVKRNASIISSPMPVVSELTVTVLSMLCHEYFSWQSTWPGNAPYTDQFSLIAVARRREPQRRHLSESRSYLSSPEVTATLLTMLMLTGRTDPVTDRQNAVYIRCVTEYRGQSEFTNRHVKYGSAE